jgi:hypothetical protein
MADVMRQSMQLGLPKLIAQLTATGDFLKSLKPLTPEECRLGWEVSNAEFDALEHHCANLVPPPPEED